MPNVPLRYQFYVWRKQMGISYEEALRTPLNIIFSDLEYISLENKYAKPKQTKGKP